MKECAFLSESNTQFLSGLESQHLGQSKELTLDKAILTMVGLCKYKNGDKYIHPVLQMFINDYIDDLDFISIRKNHMIDNKGLIDYREVLQIMIHVLQYNTDVQTTYRILFILTSLTQTTVDNWPDDEQVLRLLYKQLCQNAMHHKQSPKLLLSNIDKFGLSKLLKDIFKEYDKHMKTGDLQMWANTLQRVVSNCAYIALLSAFKQISYENCDMQEISNIASSDLLQIEHVITAKYDMELASLAQKMGGCNASIKI